MLMLLFQMGGAIGSNIFLANQAPNYWLGYGLALGMVLAAIVSTMVLRMAYGMLNKKRDQMSEEEMRAKYTEGKLIPGFRSRHQRTDARFIRRASRSR